MAATSAADASAAAAAEPSDELAVKAIHKRFECLVTARNKADRGKGAWYWAHLEPILIHDSATGLPRALKLRCSLCGAFFSASNPSRTASEHLKRGTCPNFAAAPLPISSAVPQAPGASLPSSPPPHNHRNSSSSAVRRCGTTPNPPFSVDLAYPSTISVTSAISPTGGGGSDPYSQHHQHQQQLVLSGGKDDLSALALLEDSVKRLKSPKPSLGPTLKKDQIDSALDCLADWAYESFGPASLSSLDHPKFKSFLQHVGLPTLSRRDLLGSRLDAKYEEAKAKSEAKIRDALFFQLAADWKPENDDNSFVHLSINLPNGTNVFRKAIFTSCYVPSSFAEEILRDTITEICGNAVHQCVGIVSDKFKAKALRNLESQHYWMVNICCQLQGFTSLIEDFFKELPLFNNVSENCFKLATFINDKSRIIRHTFHRYQLQEYGHAGPLKVPVTIRSDFGPVYTFLSDILSSARALQLLISDEAYKIASIDEPEIEEMMQNPNFWNELESVHSLVNIIKKMAQEIETEKPRVGQCLPLWEDLRAKIKDWCCKFHVAEGPVEKIIDGRFKKNYHPSWAAAFVLDPIYLIKDASGKYLPPFKFLTGEQDKDVDRLVTRLVSSEEAHVVLMELMKWRTEGLDPVYAQAVQLKQRDPQTGKMRIVNPQSSRLVWETYLSEFKLLGKVAVRLIFLRASLSGFECAGSLMKWGGALKTSVGMEKVQKMIFVSAHSKGGKGEYLRDDGEKDAEVFGMEKSEDDVLNEVFIDLSSV
ncbi:peptide chain release factor 2 [Striga asiatica]|uniref:Peptide chain release factor 2 n=1 Tax=Striga asiatica TaxID=4170 RepID=A0A5A7PCV9_STRAF|nr:peptide chain release factor 2 [Striga asiatica]